MGKYTLIKIAWMLVNLGYAIAIVIILENNPNAINACGPAIWQYLCVAGFVHITTIIYLASNNIYLGIITCLGESIISIWCTVIGSGGLKKQCQKTFTDHYIQLLYMVIAETIRMWVLLFGLIGISCYEDHLVRRNSRLIIRERRRRIATMV